MEKSVGDFADEHSTDAFVCTCLQIAFVASNLISFHVSNFACLWFKQGSFDIVLFGKMSDSFELVEGMEELYFQADQVSIPGSDDSAGRAQHYVEYVYEPEEDVNAPGLGFHSSAPFDLVRVLYHNFRQVFAYVMANELK